VNSPRGEMGTRPLSLNHLRVSILGLPLKLGTLGSPNLSIRKEYSTPGCPKDPLLLLLKIK